MSSDGSGAAIFWVRLLGPYLDQGGLLGLWGSWPQKLSWKREGVRGVGTSASEPPCCRLLAGAWAWGPHRSLRLACALLEVTVMSALQGIVWMTEMLCAAKG